MARLSEQFGRFELGAILQGPKVLLIALYLACDWQTVWSRVEALGLSPMSVAFAALYAFLAAGLVAAAFIPAATVRIAIAVVFVIGSVSLHSYEWSTATPFDFASFEVMWVSRGDAGDALAQHGLSLAKAVGTGLILFLAIALPPRSRRVPTRISYALPALALLGLGGITYARGGEGAHGLPAPYAPIVYAGIKTGLLFSEQTGPRKPVEIAHVDTGVIGDIVLIVDESIAANYLDINNERGVYSGLAGERPGLQILNYGIAASVTNCSAGSNRTIRYGGTRANYRLVSDIYPSVWEYARKAGYRSVYLDGQRESGTLHNLMTAQERSEIDEFVQLDGTPVVDRDHMLARMVVERLENGTPEFILVNKVGAHFPVADKFPDRAAKYLPIPERGKTTSIIDMGPVHGSHRGTPEEWQLYRNAYRNTVIWNVGGFFDYLLPRFDPAKGIILYTSDHGQDLHERGNPGKGTHCVANPNPDEGAVPMVVIDSAAAPRRDWAGFRKSLSDGTSHFRIMPTVLDLMGYKPSEVAKTYGPSLLSLERDPLSFTANYFASLGRDPGWQPIKRSSLSAPPLGDFQQAERMASADRPDMGRDH